MNTLQLKKKYIDCYPYIGHYFNGQKAERYIFRSKRLGKLVEASAYYQQINGETIRIAIEISSMVSCPISCIFCASGSLGKTYFLTVDEIVEQGKIIAKNVNSSIPIHFCFQGIGEPSLIFDNIINTSKKLLKLYPKAKFKLSTMGYNPKRIFDLAIQKIPWEAIQITLPHYQESKLKKIFKNAPRYNLIKMLKSVRKIKESKPEIRIKFNYLCIKNYNDNKQTIKGTVDLLKSNGFPLNDNTELKISFLNPTKGGEYFRIKSAKPKKHYELLKYVQNDLGVQNAYVFGAMKNIKVGCGQLIETSLRK